MGCGGSVKHCCCMASLDVGGNVAGVAGQAIQGDLEGARDAVRAAYEHTEWYRGEPDTNKADWMGGLPDDTKIVDMFLPGTHDTSASDIGKIAECQYWYSEKQVLAGIRVMDIRPKYDCDDLLIFHGIIDCRWPFQTQVEVIEAFLKAHPREAIFARIRKEGDEGDHKKFKSFHDAILSHFGDPKLWNIDFHGDWSRATLGECRGKVTPLAFGSHMHLYPQEIDIQDDYDEGDEDKKFAKIKEHAEKARDGRSLFVNFSSCVGREGVTAFKSPDMLAYEINKKVLDSFDTFKPGVYYFDFPGNGLVNKIISKNMTINTK